MADTGTALKGSPIVNAPNTNVTDPELVTIAILRNANGRPTGLNVVTRAPSDPIICWTPPPGESTPAAQGATCKWAADVQWSAGDLREHEWIEIVGKAGQPDYFGDGPGKPKRLSIDGTNATAITGGVRSPDPMYKSGVPDLDRLALSPDTRQRLKDLKATFRGLWQYSVILHSDKLSGTLTLDPVIIIVEDP